MYRIDEIKSLLFHIMFYRLFRGVAKYIVYGNTFSSFLLSVWVHDPGCLHDPSAHAHNDVVESEHAQMTILFCDDLRHCTICSTLAHLSLLSSVNTIEGIIFLI